MVVQHNLRAMNSNRMLGLTANVQAKSTEKLSSGYKINRAADDAAGLSISEKMRKQIRGLSQASLNAQDGISAVQTAEGALNEVQDMLQRMNELAIKASNGTMSEDDRSYVQNEIDQLVTEIDRVAETTKFNESYLLRGTDETVTKTLNAHDAGLAGKLTANGDGTSTFALEKALEDGDKVTIAGEEYTIGSTTASTDGYKDLATLEDEKFNVGDSVKSIGDEATYVLVDKMANDSSSYEEGDVLEIDGTTYTIAGATSLEDGELSVDDAELMITEALQNGKEAYLTEINANNDKGMYEAGDSVKVQIVTALDDSADNTEISTTSTGFTAGATPTVGDFMTVAGSTLAPGDVVTLKGTSIEATTNEPVTMDAVKDVVKQLKDGDKFIVGSKDIIIADKTDIATNMYTIDDALALINDKNTVNFGDGTTIKSAEGKAALTVAGLEEDTDYTAIESKAVPNEGNVISKTDAYKMIADEAATVTSNNSGSFTITQGTIEVKGALTFGLHVGADSDMTNKISISIGSMSAAGLGVKGLKVDGTDSTNATYAVDAILDAIQQVSTQRSALGAVQNRLEHTIANLDNVVENTTAAESQIRDTDMATEMVKYSNNNILAQAGQAMLAQANQANQGVLSLLG